MGQLPPEESFKIKSKGGVLRCQIRFDVQNDQGQGNHVAETPKTPHSIKVEAKEP
jgi:hypothetical protein